MAVFYISEQNATLRLSGGSLVVTVVNDDTQAVGTAREIRHSSIILSVEPHHLEMVAIIGHNHITSDALVFCFEQGITVAWFSRGGRLLGRATPHAPRNGDLRLAQYKLAADERGRLARAISVVKAKLANCIETLKDIRSNEEDGAHLSHAIAELEKSAETATHSGSMDALMGVEGAAAREYFAAYGVAFKSEIRFAGRNRRPPKDPANALLSFGYTLIANRLAGLIEARGMDVCLGFFHETRSGRPSLAIDLLEELRAPVVDRFVLRSSNLRIFRPEMFEGDGESEKGVLLTADGRKTFFYEWEKHLHKPMRVKNAEGKKPPLRVLHDQVELLASSLRGNCEYTPFLYGG